MTHTLLRSVSAALGAVLVFPFFSAAFDTPLSDTAVRQAYFMGQRHDESLARFLGTYNKHLQTPKTGPFISNVAFYTPYALLTLQSSEHPYGYSAQQAEIDHRGQAETVKIVITIQLTDSYSAVMPNPNRTTGTPWDYLPRPTDFWRDFEIQVSSDDQALYALKYSGEPNYICGDGGCTLVGATIELEFPAEAFTSDSASIRINPPEGAEVLVDFDLSHTR
jgi:hypothetical protein